MLCLTYMQWLVKLVLKMSPLKEILGKIKLFTGKVLQDYTRCIQDPERRVQSRRRWSVRRAVMLGSQSIGRFVDREAIRHFEKGELTL